MHEDASAGCARACWPKLAVAAVDETKPAKKPDTGRPQRVPTTRTAIWPAAPIAMTSTTSFQIVARLNAPWGSIGRSGNTGSTIRAKASSIRPSAISRSLMSSRLSRCRFDLAWTSTATTTASALAASGACIARPPSRPLVSRASSEVRPGSSLPVRR